MRTTTFFAAIVAVLALAARAEAITGGAPDEGRHPSVGALVAELPGAGRVPVCSGVLVAPAVFLTAAHCTAPLGAETMWVTLDERLDPATWTLHEGIYRADPAFGHDRADLHDLAVVLLERPVEGAPTASLPEHGLLDRASRDVQLASVGYGFNARASGGGPPRFHYDGVRRFATSPLASLISSWLRLLNASAATGEGGTCYGDSGGPIFLGASNTVVALTSVGDAACAGIGWGYRLDTRSALAFVAQFVSR